MKIYRSLGVIILVLLCFQSSLASKKVLLSDVPKMTFYKKAITTSRRGQPIKQLECDGGGAMFRSHKVKKVVCLNANMGQDWDCETKNLDGSKYRLYDIDISCEGFDYPEDPYVLKGSCGLVYKLGFVRSWTDFAPFRFLKYTKYIGLAFLTVFCLGGVFSLLSLFIKLGLGMITLPFKILRWILFIPLGVWSLLFRLVATVFQAVLFMFKLPFYIIFGYKRKSRNTSDVETSSSEDDSDEDKSIPTHQRPTVEIPPVYYPDASQISREPESAPPAPSPSQRRRRHTRRNRDTDDEYHQRSQGGFWNGFWTGNFVSNLFRPRPFFRPRLFHGWHRPHVHHHYHSPRPRSFFSGNTSSHTRSSPRRSNRSRHTTVRSSRSSSSRGASGSGRVSRR
ncbi:hypothetical protein PCE1_001128 [Barthelona sp. PCE]